MFKTAKILEMNFYKIKQTSWIFSALFFLLGIHVSEAIETIQPNSARVFGMGSAFTAVADDDYSIFYNPAGLSTLKHLELSGGMGRYLSGQERAETELHWIGALPLELYRSHWNYGSIAAWFQHSGRKDFRSFTQLSMAWGLPMARLRPKKYSVIKNRFFDRSHVGFSTGIKRQGRGDNNNLGLGFDLGYLYYFDEGDTIYKKGWSAGLSLRDINSGGISTPLLYRLGTAWRNPYAILALDWTIESGVSKFFPGIEIPIYRRLIQLRLGTADADGPSRQMTVGTGIVLPPIQMDFAYGFPLGNALSADDRWIFGFTYRFGTALLSQYFFQERIEKASEAETQVAELESKKNTLQASIHEQQKLFTQTAADLEKMIQNRSAADDELKTLQQQIQKIKTELHPHMQGLEQKSIYQDPHSKKIQSQKISVRAPGSPGPKRKHKTIEGDTLRDLANQYYGNPNLWKTIYDANIKKMIRGTPKVGAELLIP